MFNYIYSVEIYIYIADTFIQYDLPEIQVAPL